MRRKISPFKLGLFVLMGAAVVVGSLLWIGAARLFQNTKTYVTFFHQEEYTTLHRFLVQRQKGHPGARGELTRVVEQIGVVGKIISNCMRREARRGSALGFGPSILKQPASRESSGKSLWPHPSPPARHPTPKLSASPSR